MRLPLVALLCGALLVPACADGGSGDDRVRVVSAVYPLSFVAQRVGGATVDVVEVAPPGAEPHDLELTPDAVGEVERADVVLLVRGFQPALEDAAPDDRTLDVLDAGDDPHVWLDPSALASVAAQVAERLRTADPDGEYDPRPLMSELIALDTEIRERLDECARRDIVTSHAAFGRFAARYNLRETAIAGVDAEAEPSPRRLADVAAFVKRQGVTTVFAESPDARPARTVAREAGVRVEVLDPIEVFRGDDYFTVMRRNAAVLATALGCR